MSYKNFLPARQSVVVEDQSLIIKDNDLRHTMKSVAATTEKVEEHKERYHREIEHGVESRKFGRRNKKAEGGE